MPRVAAALATDTTFITAASPATALTAVTAAATFAYQLRGACGGEIATESKNKTGLRSSSSVNA